MTKSDVSVKDTVSVPREVRPFLLLAPAPAAPVHEPAGLARLDQALGDQIPQLVRSLVDYTIARQNGRALERGNPQPIPLSVLNRRRRAARSWLVAIAAGLADPATAHTFAAQWLPLLTGTGPDLAAAVAPGRDLVEFVRGACTACIFDAPCASLLPHAKALHVLEATLATHLGALVRSEGAATTGRRGRRG
ncbi:MAG: hypothetical protein JNK15_13970 [Planctomycetes bacterium]|nr:hypothetical protein [Planctomycetota bacterium]